MNIQSPPQHSLSEYAYNTCLQSYLNVGFRYLIGLILTIYRAQPDAKHEKQNGNTTAPSVVQFSVQGMHIEWRTSIQSHKNVQMINWFQNTFLSVKIKINFYFILFKLKSHKAHPWMELHNFSQACKRIEKVTASLGMQIFIHLNIILLSVK